MEIVWKAWQLINLFQKDESIFENQDTTTTEKVNVTNVKLGSDIDRFVLNIILNEVFEDTSLVYDRLNFMFFTVE